MDECCTKITTLSSSNHSMVSLQALGGLGGGIIALKYPGILYWDFTNVDEILRMGKSASAPGIWLMTQLAGAKVVATALCRGSGLVGGLYAPSLMIGAALGAVFGGSAAEIINSAIPGNVAVAQPQAYAQVGIAATLASVCSVPLTSVLLLFELTKDYRILLALMEDRFFNDLPTTLHKSNAGLPIFGGLCPYLTYDALVHLWRDMSNFVSDLSHKKWLL
ncbi:chloride channel protein CLC-f-like isoform X1 [Magnolia sinica]|uniref:chloride channel protein CLC-f-like isoform X1 n=1 Tax=Magnolia sinica TaxID=86752 RepID=UPI00265B5AF9|nr:chloride channel protein CLC-f-like isoform X1 [Magnolia sinica]